eukprot:m51a1_g6707 hypothetical protein (335) ;mRNA; f:114807-115954
MSQKYVRTILLNALPAAGKSEVRNFLQSESAFARSFMVGAPVYLDDYPYVRFMREIDQALNAAGFHRLFFELYDRNFITGYEWGTLTELVNEDYADLVANARPPVLVGSYTRWLLERIDRAAAKVGIARMCGDIPAKAAWAVEQRMEASIKEFFVSKYANHQSLEGKTIIIEFARGGPEGHPFPLRDPQGYQYTYRMLSEQILSEAAVLYIWVTPEMSRAKNVARGQEKPTKQGVEAYVLSLNHSVPDYVMRNEYGVDDIDYLLSASDRKGTICVEKSGRRFYLPVARFDNREDYTTFCRGSPASWPEASRKAITEQLSKAFAVLVEQYRILHP